MAIDHSWLVHISPVTVDLFLACAYQPSDGRFVPGLCISVR